MQEAGEHLTYRDAFATQSASTDTLDQTLASLGTQKARRYGEQS
jgi:hypothetical protein